VTGGNVATRWRTVVVDDEQLARERVTDLVKAHPRLELAGEASDGASALDLIGETRPDIVFLDIRMPELDGFEVIAALGEDVLPAIVFVTAYDEYAIRAFDVDAIDYVLKPVTVERFEAAVTRVLGRLERRAPPMDELVRALVSRALEQQATPSTRFVARRGAKHYFVKAADIDWVEATGNYVRLQTGDKSHLIRETMNAMESRLDPARFVRIHRSVFVAIDRILSVETRPEGEYLVTLHGGTRFVSSRSYAERVRKLLR
jgi:two-component system LytT family response regulator